MANFTEKLPSDLYQGLLHPAKQRGFKRGWVDHVFLEVMKYSSPQNFKKLAPRKSKKGYANDLIQSYLSDYKRRNKL